MLYYSVPSSNRHPPPFSAPTQMPPLLKAITLSGINVLDQQPTMVVRRYKYVKLLALQVMRHPSHEEGQGIYSPPHSVLWECQSFVAYW
jgi:hypothetical protein